MVVEQNWVIELDRLRSTGENNSIDSRSAGRFTPKGIEMAAKETEVATVKMDDGRVVDFPGKRRLQKESIITADGEVKIRLDFRNGETRLFRLPPSLLLKFAQDLERDMIYSIVLLFGGNAQQAKEFLYKNSS